MGPDNMKFKPGVYVKLEPAEVTLQDVRPAIEMPSEAFARLRKENCELAFELMRTKMQLKLAKFRLRPEMMIENVIFNDPATIVFWADDSKTVVKCQPGDTFSKELGLAMAICKKVYGNKGNYNDVFKKWVPQDE